jgi:hypothetical protein
MDQPKKHLPENRNVAGRKLLRETIPAAYQGGTPPQ